MNRVFVYGTLKEGFANFSVNAGRRVAGMFRTVDCLPLYVVGERGLPWLVNQPGQGRQVVGEVFEVDDAGLQDMDRLERVHESGWYTREEIWVREVGFRPIDPIQAYVYFGALEKLDTALVQAGPLAEFTLEFDSRYRRNAA